MIFQKKQSIVLRNFFSVIMLILITVLACRQLNVAIQKGNVDYWTLQQTAWSPEKSYQLFYSARVQKMERTKTATQIWLAPDKRPEVNLNTPLMTCFVKVIMRAKTTVMNASVWIALSLLCAAISIAGLLYWMQDNFRYWNDLPSYLLLAWASWPSLYALQQGQVSWFVLPVLVVAFLLEVFDCRRYAAITLGVLASLKLFFLIFALLYVTRFEWRLFMLFFAAFLCAFCLPLLYFSWQNYLQYGALLQNHVIIVSRAIAQMNGTVLGFVANVVRQLPIVSPLNVILLIASLIIVYGVFTWIRFDLKVIRTLPVFHAEIRFAFLILLALLFSPLAWLYYFIFLIVPYAVIAKISYRYALSKTTWGFLIAGFVLPLLCFFQEIALFCGLLCWVFSLRAATHDVQNARSSKKQAQYFIVLIPVCYAACSLILFSFIPGGQYFWQWNKAAYFNAVMPTIVIAPSTMTTSR